MNPRDWQQYHDGSRMTSVYYCIEPLNVSVIQMWCPFCNVFVDTADNQSRQRRQWAALHLHSRKQPEIRNWYLTRQWR